PRAVRQQLRRTGEKHFSVTDQPEWVPSQRARRLSSNLHPATDPMPVFFRCLTAALRRNNDFEEKPDCNNYAVGPGLAAFVPLTTTGAAAEPCLWPGLPRDNYRTSV